MEIEIIAIRKDNGNHLNPHEAIQMYRWRSTSEIGETGRIDMVKWLNKPENEAYVSTGFRKVYCVIKRSVNGNYFLQTQSDGVDTNNLLSLPEF